MGVLPFCILMYAPSAVSNSSLFYLRSPSSIVRTAPLIRLFVRLGLLRSPWGSLKELLALVNETPCL